MCIPVGLEFTIQPVCQGPMAEAELIIPKREEGRERKGERGTRTHAISRFAIVGESLLLLDPGSFHLRRSLFDSRPRGQTTRGIDSRFSCVSCIITRGRGDLSLNCNVMSKLVSWKPFQSYVSSSKMLLYYYLTFHLYCVNLAILIYALNKTIIYKNFHKCI